MARHIFLTGKKQIGKSTLLQKILKNYQGTADGFLTVRTKEYPYVSSDRTQKSK